jgi:hypothetical protein
MNPASCRVFFGFCAKSRYMRGDVSHGTRHRRRHGSPTDVELLARLLVARLVLLCGRSEAVRILEWVVAELKAAVPGQGTNPRNSTSIG